MFKLSFSDVLALLAIPFTIVLLVLDKAGKLKGSTLFVLLALAGALTLPAALNVAWVSDAQGLARVARGLLIVFSVGLIYSAIAVWVVGSDSITESKEKYELLGTVYSVGVGTPSNQPQDVSAFIIANVRNVGIPTIVTDWSLEVSPPGRRPVEGRGRFIVPNQPVTFMMSNGIPWIMSPDDALYNKGVAKPVPSGDQITGLLIFDFHNTGKIDIYREGVVYDLSFGDVKGNRYHAFKTLEAKSDTQPMYFPGMKAVPQEVPTPPNKLKP
jgi:hypothetical protein